MPPKNPWECKPISSGDLSSDQCRLTILKRRDNLIIVVCEFYLFFFI
jgi:hypothetical protein